MQTWVLRYIRRCFDAFVWLYEHFNGHSSSSEVGGEKWSKTVKGKIDCFYIYYLRDVGEDLGAMKDADGNEIAPYNLDLYVDSATGSHILPPVKRPAINPPVSAIKGIRSKKFVFTAGTSPDMLAVAGDSDSSCMRCMDPLSGCACGKSTIKWENVLSVKGSTPGVRADGKYGKRELLAQSAKLGGILVLEPKPGSESKFMFGQITKDSSGDWKLEKRTKDEERGGLLCACVVGLRGGGDADGGRAVGCLHAI